MTQSETQHVLCCRFCLTADATCALRCTCCLQVNLYIDPEDFDGLGNLGWCPLIYGREQLGCQLPTIKQLLEMSSGLLPTDNMGCGTANSTWTSGDWFWQYR